MSHSKSSSRKRGKSSSRKRRSRSYMPSGAVHKPVHKSLSYFPPKSEKLETGKRVSPSAKPNIKSMKHATGTRSKKKTRTTAVEKARTKPRNPKPWKSSKESGGEAAADRPQIKPPKPPSGMKLVKTTDKRKIPSLVKKKERAGPSELQKTASPKTSTPLSTKYKRLVGSENVPLELQIKPREEITVTETITYTYKPTVKSQQPPATGGTATGTRTETMVFPKDTTQYDNTQWEHVTIATTFNPQITAESTDPEEKFCVGTEDVEEGQQKIPGEENQQQTYNTLDYLKKRPVVMTLIRIFQTALCVLNIGLLLGPHAPFLQAEYGLVGIPVCAVLVLLVCGVSVSLGITFFLRMHIGEDRLKNHWRIASILTDLAACTTLLTASALALNYGTGYTVAKFGTKSNDSLVHSTNLHSPWLASGTLLFLQIVPHGFLMIRMLQAGPGPNF